MSISDPWWSQIAPILTAVAACLAGWAAVRGAQGKRVRAEQQTELVEKIESVELALAEAQRKRDEIANQLTDEQKKCREESKLLREEIAKQSSVTEELLRMVK